jgi:integrase
MARPRRNHTGLPSYCYRDKRNGRLFMLAPDGGKLRRRSFDSLDALLAAWRTTWGEAARDGAATVGDLLDAFLAGLQGRVDKGDLAASTAVDYTRCVISLRPIWGAVRIEDVDVPALYRWRDARGEDARVRANRERTVLFEAFKPAVRTGLIKDNPVRFLEPFREKPRERYVTDDEFMAVYVVAPPVVQAAMLLSAVTGLRQGDILRLRRSDFTESGLSVRTGKTGKVLEFGWSEGLRRAVLVAVGARDFIPLVLLSTQTGEAYTSDGFRTLWHKAMKAAREARPSMPRWTFHDLRAKAGSESRDWRLLGHMDQRTFERVYNRLPRRVIPTR